MNEPAFPSFNYITQEGRENPQGMTLRDYFAAKALPCCLKNCFSMSGAVEEAYEIADAMLEERK
jgi:hypothetical protein